MKAVVTGGGGFLGRHIVRQLLQRGDDVTAFARGLYPELEQMGARVVRGDIADKAAVLDACTGAQAVFHVAALASAWGVWEDFHRTNILGTQNVIDACRKAGVGRLVFTSTPSVVADDRARAGIDETHPYPRQFDSHYAHSKAVAERMIVDANSAELRTVALRPRAIFGPGDTQLFARIVARARTGSLIQIGDGTNKSDVSYVEDAARAHLLAADALERNPVVAGSVYFISQDEPVNVWDFIKRLTAELGCPPIKHRLSLPAARRLAAIVETVHRCLRLRGEPQLVRFVVNELALDCYADISKAKRDLGYAPMITVEEGLRRTIAYFRDL